VYGEICLLVTNQIQFSDGHRAGNGFLENGRLDGNTFPDGLLWQPNINGDDFHARRPILCGSGTASCRTASTASVMIATTLSGTEASGVWSTSILLRCSLLPPIYAIELASEKVANGVCNFLNVRFERKMAGVVEMHLRIWIVALECFGSWRQEKWIVLSPNSQQWHTFCPEILLELGIER